MYQLTGQDDKDSQTGRHQRRNAAARELEGARVEKLRSLRISHAGYLGAMNRSQKLIEQLLLDPENCDAVVTERASGNKVFNDYIKCCQDYRACLSANETGELEKALGYLPQKSIVAQVLLCFNDWTEARNDGNATDVVFLDFAKAFDSVPHERLLYKLEQFGIVGSLLMWFRNFLVGRQQRVIV